MRKWYQDVARFCVAVADRARFYLRCALESDIIDACIVILACLGILGAILLISGCFTSVWFARLLGR